MIAISKSSTTMDIIIMIIVCSDSSSSGVFPECIEYYNCVSSNIYTISYVHVYLFNHILNTIQPKKFPKFGIKSSYISCSVLGIILKFQLR